MARGVVAAGTCALALGACRPTTSAVSGPVYEVTTASVGGVGTVLVDGQGYTLYLFEPDHQSSSTCVGSCAEAWPPLVLPSGVSAPRAGHGVHEALLGTVARTNGSLQVTYDHWPLYRWVGDTRPGIATGEARNNLGGCWYTLRPDGSAVKTMACV